jgi:hypothetical protein
MLGKLQDIQTRSCIIKQLNYGNSFFNKLTKHKKEIKSPKWFCNYCMWLQQDVTNACQSAKWIILNSDMINCVFWILFMRLTMANVPGKCPSSLALTF